MKKTSYLILFIFLALTGSIETKAQWTKEQTTRYRDSLMLVLKNSKEDSNRVKTLDWLYWSYFGESDKDALRYANDALSLSRKIKFSWGEARVNYFLGLYWNFKSEHAKALTYQLVCLNIAGEKNFLGLYINAYWEIAGIYFKLSNYPESIKYYLSLLKIVQDNKREGMLSSTWLSLGQVYFKQGNYEESLKYYELAYHQSIKRNFKFQTGYILHQIGTTYKTWGKNQEALNRFSSALNIYMSLEDSILKKHADNEYMRAQFHGETGYTHFDKATVSVDSSIYYYKQSISYLNIALPVYEKGEIKDELIKIYTTLSKACEAINDFKNAHQYITLAAAIKDSVYSKESYAKIANTKAQFEIEKAIAEEKAKSEKEKLQEEAARTVLLANQQLQQEKKLNEEKIAHEKAIAEEKLKSEKSLASEKANQEKIKAENQQMNNLLLMGLVLVAVTSVFLILYLRQRHEKKIAVEKVETIHKMAELELQSLRAQLNPHFMFNSLNSLQRLILMEESDKSQSYLARFSKMLRMLLENADKPFIPLQKEIDFLQLYLGLEKLRVPDLQYSISTDPSLNTEQTLIPNMILQPYVENAIWHGLSHKENDKQVQVRIFRENGTLNCEVEDNGVGRKKAEELKSLFRKQHQSKGMELLTKRFKLLNEEFGSSIQASITDKNGNDKESGTLVSIKIPVMQIA